MYILLGTTTKNNIFIYVNWYCDQRKNVVTFNCNQLFSQQTTITLWLRAYIYCFDKYMNDSVEAVNYVSTCTQVQMQYYNIYK